MSPQHKPRGEGMGCRPSDEAQPPVEPYPAGALSAAREKKSIAGMTVGVSSSIRNIGKRLASAEGLGVGALEISYHADDARRLTEESVREIGQKAKRLGVEFIVHAPPYDPMKSGLGVFEEALKFARDIGAPLMIMHLHKPIEGFVGAVRPLGEKAKEYGVRVGVENVFSRFLVSASESSMGGSMRSHTADELYQAIRGLSEGNEGVFGAVFDSGHANSRYEPDGPANFLKRLLELGCPLFDVHLSDNRGASHQHRNLGDGNIDFKTIIATLRGAGYKGTLKIEQRGKSPREIESSIRLLERLCGGETPVPGVVEAGGFVGERRLKTGEALELLQGELKGRRLPSVDRFGGLELFEDYDTPSERAAALVEKGEATLIRRGNRYFLVMED